MGFVMRKSFKIAPGVRMTVSKSGISASAGIKGARITKSTTGRTTRTIGIPGTGVYHTKSSRSGTQSQRSTPASTPGPAAPKPGVFDPKWEKELYRALSRGNLTNLVKIGQAYPESRLVVMPLRALEAMTTGDNESALTLMRAAWQMPPVEEHPFTQKYLAAASSVTVEIAQGVSATMPISRDAVGLALAELEQEAGNLEAAIAVVEHLEPSVIAAVSLSELYLQTGRADEVIDITNGVTNVDDPTALLVAYRGVAFREQGLPAASREALKEALKSRSRDVSIRQFALVERAKTYQAEGKPALARKDLERVLAQDANYPGLRGLLEGDGLAAPQQEPETATTALNTSVAATAPEPNAEDNGVAAPLAPIPRPDAPTTTALGPTTGAPSRVPNSKESNVPAVAPAPLPELEGYGIRVRFDGYSLRITATNRLAAAALLGPGYKEGAVTVPSDHVAKVKFTDATRLVNGSVDIRTTDGQRYQLHFRHKHRDQPWKDLAGMLGS